MKFVRQGGRQVEGEETWGFEYNWKVEKSSLEVPLMAECAGKVHPKAVEGIRLFNQGKYFEAHEELEIAWMEEKGAIRDLYRGILQVAVAYYHIERGNYTGARKMLQRCRRWLAPFPDRCRGVRVAQLRADYQAVEDALRRLGPGRIEQFNPGLFRPVEVDPSSPE